MLDAAAGIPIRALALAEGENDSVESRVIQVMLKLAEGEIDPVTAASELIKKSELSEILTPIQLMLSRIIKIKFSLKHDIALKKGDDGVFLQIGKRLNFKQLYAFLDKVSESKQLAGGPLDDTLALEADLISWQQLFG